MSQPVNLAIFGVGRAGWLHIPNVISNRHFRLKYLVDIDMKRLEATRDEFQLHETQLILSSDTDVVFNDSSIRGIIVASTTHTHEDIVTRAVKKRELLCCCHLPPLSDVTSLCRLFSIMNWLLHLSISDYYKLYINSS